MLQYIEEVVGIEIDDIYNDFCYRNIQRADTPTFYQVTDSMLKTMIESLIEAEDFEDFAQNELELYQLDNCN